MINVALRLLIVPVRYKKFCYKYYLFENYFLKITVIQGWEKFHGKII